MLRDPHPTRRRDDGRRSGDVEGGDDAAAGAAGVDQCGAVHGRYRDHGRLKCFDPAGHLGGGQSLGLECSQEGAGLDRRGLAGDDVGEGGIGFGGGEVVAAHRFGNEGDQGGGGVGQRVGRTRG